MGGMLRRELGPDVVERQFEARGIDGGQAPEHALSRRITLTLTTCSPESDWLVKPSHGGESLSSWHTSWASMPINNRGSRQRKRFLSLCKHGAHVRPPTARGSTGMKGSGLLRWIAKDARIGR